LSLTHIGSGTNDWWTSVSDAYGATYSVVTNNGQIADVMIRNPIAQRQPGAVSQRRLGLGGTSRHARGRGWFLHLPRLAALAEPAGGVLHGGQLAGRLSSIFSCADNGNGTTSYAWDFCNSDVPIGLSVGGNPPGSTSAGVPGEVVIMPYTNYFTQPTGTNYEPGWPAYTQPCGLTSDLHPTWTKYDWSSYQGLPLPRNAWGASTETVGVFTLLGSAEFINGGPTKLKGRGVRQLHV
jgi:hypothetical protein